jgi:hypothetical protein
VKREKEAARNKNEFFVLADSYELMAMSLLPDLCS